MWGVRLRQFFHTEKSTIPHNLQNITDWWYLTNRVIVSKGGFFPLRGIEQFWPECHRVLLERKQITGTKGYIDESVRRGAERKIGRKGSGLWTTQKKQWLSLNKASEDVFMTPCLVERLVYLFKGSAFWHSGSRTTWRYLRKKVGTGCFLRPGGENGESASCPVLFWCRLIADVVVRKERLTQARLVMEGEGKKNSFTTRQHVLLPVFVSTYYVLPACSWGWGNVWP